MAVISKDGKICPAKHCCKAWPTPSQSWNVFDKTGNKTAERSVVTQELYMGCRELSFGPGSNVQIAGSGAPPTPSQTWQPDVDQIKLLRGLWLSVNDMVKSDKTQDMPTPVFFIYPQEGLGPTKLAVLDGPFVMIAAYTNGDWRMVHLESAWTLPNSPRWTHYATTSVIDLNGDSRPEVVVRLQPDDACDWSIVLEQITDWRPYRWILTTSSVGSCTI